MAYKDPAVRKDFMVLCTGEGPTNLEINGLEPISSCVQSKHSTIELYPLPPPAQFLVAIVGCKTFPDHKAPEATGFEPMIHIKNVCRFSKPVPSTAQPCFLTGLQFLLQKNKCSLQSENFGLCRRP